MRTKPSGAIIAGVVVGLLVYALAGYFLLISPQSGKAADLKRQTDATQQQIDQYRTLAAQARATPPIRVAELFRLTKAMPDSVDMAGVILELSRVARASGIEFDSITPQGATPVAGLLDHSSHRRVRRELLRALRLPVPAPQPRARARGRPGCAGTLFVVDAISFGESTKAFPRIKASLTVHAFVYGDLSVGRPAGRLRPRPPRRTRRRRPTTSPPRPRPSPDTPPEGASAAPETP